MTDTLPDRLSTNPASPYFDQGRPLTLKLTGEVEAWIENPAQGDHTAEGSEEAGA